MSIHRSALTSASLGVLLLLWPKGALGQACCAGMGSVTPARLLPHDIALVGLTVKGGDSLGEFDSAGHFQGEPKGAYGLNFEQDLFAAVRVLNRAEVALLVPVLESRQVSPNNAGTTTDSGGGIGDLNASARVDLTRTRYGSHLPGIGILAGATFPTGRSYLSPSAGVLGAGITGVGAYQMSLGISVEEAVTDAWVVSASGIFAQRFPTTVNQAGQELHVELAPQWTALLAVAHFFDDGASLGVSGSFVAEGAGTITDNGVASPGLGRRSLTASVFGAFPISDHFRFQAAVYDLLPLNTLGLNQSTVPLGVSATIIHAWM